MGDYALDKSKSQEPVGKVLIRPPLPWPSSNHCFNPILKTLAQIATRLPNDVVVLPCIKG